MINKDKYKEKNLAAVLFAKRDVRVLDLNDPPLKDYQVRVKINVSAICGTQLGEWKQNRGVDNFLPHCFGHEAVGRILEVGSKIKEFKQGDRVIISWMKNANDHGSAAQFIDTENSEFINFGECCTFIRRGIFPANRLTKISELLDDKDVAMVGCAFLTAFAALKVSTNGFKKIQKPIAIIGLGGIGLSYALLAKAYGIQSVCIDLPGVINELKKDNLNLNLISTKQAEEKYTNTLTCVVICSGAVNAFGLGEKLLKFNEGELYIVGNPEYGIKIGFDIKPMLYGRKIIGIGEKDVHLPDDIQTIISLIISKKLDSSKIVRKTFNLSNINTAFEVADSGLGGRTLIEI